MIGKTWMASSRMERRRRRRRRTEEDEGKEAKGRKAEVSPSMLEPWPGSSHCASGLSLGMDPCISYPLGIGTASSNKMFSEQKIMTLLKTFFWRCAGFWPHCSIIRHYLVPPYTHKPTTLLDQFPQSLKVYLQFLCFWSLLRKNSRFNFKFHQFPALQPTRWLTRPSLPRHVLCFKGTRYLACHWSRVGCLNQ